MKAALPKEYYNLGGISITAVGDVAAARRLQAEVSKLMFLCHAENTAKLPQYWKTLYFEDGSYIKVDTNFGVDSAVVFVPLVPKPEEKRKVRHEIITRKPVACFELLHEPEFIGFYVCGDLSWKQMLFDARNENRPYTSSNYNGLNADGWLNQEARLWLYSKVNPQKYLEVYPLRKIGTPDLDDSEYVSETIIEGGYFYPLPPESPPFWIFLSDLGGHACSVSLNNCFEVLGEAAPPPGYWYDGLVTIFVGNPQIVFGFGGFVMANSYCPNKDIVYCGGCTDPTWGDTFQYGETVTYWYTRTTIADSSISLAGIPIYSSSPISGVSYTAAAYDYGCSSYSTTRNWEDGEDSNMLASSIVRGVDGYDDDTVWIALYEVYVYDYDSAVSCSPWFFEPENNSFPDFAEYTYNIYYWAKIRTSDFEIEFQFAEPMLHISNELDVDVFTCEIYDFHGTPVFIFSWWDERDNMMRYCSVFRNTVYFSEAFPILDESITGQAFYHIVGKSVERYNGYAQGWGRAVGLAEIREEEYEL